MPRFGAHAFLWIDDWTAVKGDQAIDAAAATGFDFIEIPMLRPDAFDAAHHRKVLGDAGIAATVSLVLPAGAHMPDRPREAIAFLGAALDQVETLGATFLCGCLAYHLGRLTGAPPTDAEHAVVAETLAVVAEDAARRGVTLGFEVCNRYETYLYNTLADGQEAIRRIGAPNVQLHADTYHMNIEEEGFAGPLIEAGDTLGYIHMSESHRGLVGTGTIDWEEVFQGLATADYRGPLVLESFAAINPDLAAATCLWRSPRHSSDVMAREGLRALQDGAARAGLV